MRTQQRRLLWNSGYLGSLYHGIFWGSGLHPLIALCLTFGLTTLVVGHLNILSVVFAPLLLGLGIDYGTHWLSRYQEELASNGLSRRDAIEKTMVKLGPGLIYAGFSAALSFFPLTLTGFKGLVELGIICSMGMLVTTTTSMCVLPAITLLFDRGARPKKASLSLQRPLFQFTGQRAMCILTVSCVLLAGSLFLASGISFDMNLLHLQSKSSESVIWEKKLLDDSKRSSMYGAILARSMEEVRSKARAVEVLATVSDVVSVETFLPQDQEDKLDVVRSMSALVPGSLASAGQAAPVDVKSLRSTLSRIAFKLATADPTDLRERPDLEKQMKQARKVLARIDERLNAGTVSKSGDALQGFQDALMGDLKDKMTTLRANTERTAAVQLSDLPRNLLRRYFDGSHLYLIRVFPAQDIWQPELLGRFVEELRSVDADAIGDPVTLFTFTKAFRDGCITAVFYALIFIVAMLLYVFRSPMHTLLAMVPLVVGTAWTMGLMRCFGISLNLANTLFLPMIVGAGVEYAIIIVQRWRMGGSSGVLPLSTGKGVILAGLTTTIGFGSLTIAGHQGIHSLGLLSAIGSLCVLGAALLTLPAILHLLSTSSKKKASS